MTIELNEYGFMLDMGDFIYLSLSWAMLKSPWIRESVEAYRSADEAQIATVEAIRKQWYGF